MTREIAVRITVTGRVQGVGFRMWTVREAARRHIRGWVRNRQNGDVEALLIGIPADVETLIESCRVGPRMAEVLRLAREPASDDGSSQFHERPTV